MKKLTLSNSAWAVPLLLLTETVFAQFAGDVFFEQPSVGVAPGDEGELTLAVFGGDFPLGAFHTRLTFDPLALEVVDVTPVAGDSAPLVEWSGSDGMVDLVMLNNTGLDRPVGTTSLATVVVRPLVGSGSVIEVDAQVVDSLTATFDTYPSSVAFGAEVVVGTQSLQKSSAADAVLMKGDAQYEVLLDRAARLRPRGAVVDLAASLPGGVYAYRTLQPAELATEELP